MISMATSYAAQLRPINVRTKPSHWVLPLLLMATVAAAQQSSLTREPQLKTRTDADVHSTAIPSIRGMQCVTFNPKTLTEKEIARGPTLHGYLHWLYGTEQSQDDHEVLRIIQGYGMNASCWIDDPFSPFHFMLVDGKAPTGKIKGEECFAHHLSHLHLVQLRDNEGTGHNYRVIADNKDGQMRMFAFATKRAADAALAAINRFAFTQECYFRRTPAGISFNYLKAE
ncbi:MAG: hypothetical protein JWO13_2336 [Acidobacteriales bacterium]|nr:hypothetical protein [Terriglobales bacterium]